MHKPIQINQLSIQFSTKTCFEDFSQQIHAGERIAILGRNGTGKTSLLSMLAGIAPPTAGSILLPNDVELAYIPQLPEQHKSLSGGQLFCQALDNAMQTMPNALLLDEPTNHLDETNQKMLQDTIKYFYGTVIVVSHDIDLIEQCFDIIWYIDQEIIQVFHGKYSNFIAQRNRKIEHLQQQSQQLNQDKKQVHLKLMQEQKRAAKNKVKGKKSIHNKKWATVVSHAKAGRAQQTSGKKQSSIQQNKEKTIDTIKQLSNQSIAMPSFQVLAEQNHGELIRITDGTIGYGNKPKLLHNMHFYLQAKERALLKGDNGSGKSSLIKAILQECSVMRTGDWQVIDKEKIGYLDQYYAMVPSDTSIFDAIQQVQPSWDSTTVYNYLASFLFKGSEQVQQLTNFLSGGEQARLALAMIAANPPHLLILDEVTNNLDIETIEHMIQIVKHFPGALLVISHHQYFINSIAIDRIYSLQGGEISEKI